MSSKRGRARSRVRTQWLALGAAMVVLAGVLVAWALSNAADRVQVVQVARAVQAGDLIDTDDLTVTGVAYDSNVQGLVPAESLGALVGRVAAIDLQAGAIAQVGMWRDAPVLAPGEQSVGALLPAGHFPDGTARGSIAIAASVDPAGGGVAVAVRVIDAVAGTDGGLLVTLAVPAERSIDVARLAATEQLLLVGQPAVVGE